MDQLPLFYNLGGQPVLVLGDGEAAAAKARLVARAGGTVVTDEAAPDSQPVRLAFVGIDDEAAALAAAQRLRARGLLVNVVDRPAACDFTTPAVIDRAPLLLAIGTGGASAGLAKALRQRLEALLPARLGALARALGDARAAVRTRWPDKDDRRRAIDAALAPGGALDPLALDGEATGAVARWLRAGQGADAAGTVIPMRLASADPDDLTLRQARLLGGADVVAFAPGVPDVVLDRVRADAARMARAVPPPAVAGQVIIWLTMGAGPDATGS